ncbi:uncharacterized protein LOC132631073 [Lycium barbarum]|uniref:uncharacterized protein LOC132631073 n=1 Tax=Lycium barbarum TaxID=112863 RepID=UPI00293F37F3|nr:uncharacterized protein LOC132631073 [Lycium barbarum]
MKRFYQVIQTPSSSGLSSPVPNSSSCPVVHDKDKVLDLNLPKPDPGERKQISQYSYNERDRIRRHYIQKGPCQPRDHIFPKREFGGLMRQFNPDWFGTSYSEWLEYSVKLDAGFCLCCYLFKNEHGRVGDSFTKHGFRAWNKGIERLNRYIGDVNSLHNRCFKRMRDLKNQEQSIVTSFDKHNEKDKNNYQVRLNASVDVTRFLLKQGMPFRGHDEGETSTKRGNFLELLKWYANRHDEVNKVVLENAPQNNMMIAPSIQKEIVNACAKETLKAIIEDLNGDYFGILVDESKDVSHKEQMALVLRYVNKEGTLIERFLSVVHVKDTSAIALKDAIYSLLLEHSLSPSQIRGQGYDGASNMQGKINGLKTLVLEDTPSAYCIHCFAHQLQLTLVAVAKKHYDVDQFFDIFANVLNIVGGSFKRREILREDQAKKLEELLVLGEVYTGSGLNQELGLQRPGDTRWGSHFKTVHNFIALFSSIVHVLEVIAREGTTYLERSMAKSLVNDIRSFEFVHMLKMMLKVLAITNDLNMTLQRKYQDIVNAMKLVGFAKRQLQSMRESKWESLIEDVSSFCVKHDILIPEMDKNYHIGKSKRKSSSVTYSHHLHVEVFNAVIDLQLAELNSRFDAVNSDLLLGMASLSPDNSFANYDKDKIMKLGTLYRDEFSVSKLEDLSYELDNYILFVREDSDFSNLKGIRDLSETLVETNLHKTWRLVYLLVKLSLILPVATATVERAFSSMKYIKNDLRSRIGDQFLNDCLVCYIEDEVFESVPNDAIIDRFQNMTSRRGQL